MKDNSDKSGFILVDKPVGLTSHDVVDRLRKITGIKKIGHAGTLDPLAGGCLLLAVSRQATRQISLFVKLDKEYIADINLSATTDTFDREGKITKKFLNQKIPLKIIKETIKSFLGKQKQIPPMFSAKKIAGKKLYELARAGKEVERQPAEIEIFKIKIIKYNWPILKIKVKCSSGTYIRSLAFDIGAKAGVGGFLESLERTAIGKYKLKKAIKLEKVNKENWLEFLRNSNK